MALAQDRQQVVDHAAHVRDVDLDVHVGGRVRREHDVVRLGGVLHRTRQLEPVALQHALEQLLRAGLRERHLAGRELVEHPLLALDADRVAALGPRTTARGEGRPGRGR